MAALEIKSSPELSHYSSPSIEGMPNPNPVTDQAYVIRSRLDLCHWLSRNNFFEYILIFWENNIQTIDQLVEASEEYLSPLINQMRPEDAERFWAEWEVKKENRAEELKEEEKFEAGKDFELDSSHDENEVIRIVVLGASGSGKSSLCNTLCGQPGKFAVGDGWDSQTNEIQQMEFDVEVDPGKSRKFQIIDTPGFFDTNDDVGERDSKIHERIANQLQNLVEISQDGISAFLIVVPFERLNAEQEKTLQIIQNIFQDDGDDFSWLVFTKSDGRSAEEIISKTNRNNKRASSVVWNYIARLEGRVFAVENRGENLDEQRQLLLSTIAAHADALGRCYDNVWFHLVRRLKHIAQRQWLSSLQWLGGGAVVGVGLFTLIFGRRVQVGQRIMEHFPRFASSVLDGQVRRIAWVGTS